MRTILITLLAFLVFTLANAETFVVKSPDKSLSVEVDVSHLTTYKVLKNNELIIAPSTVQLNTNVKCFGADYNKLRSQTSTTKQTLTPVISYKTSTIEDNYNELAISYDSNYQLIFRVYDEGYAFRWKSNFKNDLTVYSEKAEFIFAGNHEVLFPEEEEFYSAQERLYTQTKLSEITAKRFCSTPTYLRTLSGVKIWISEADLYNYPGMFLSGMADKNGLQGLYAPYPKRVRRKTDRDEFVRETYNYIAKTKGANDFPWRICLVAKSDVDIAESQIVYKLSKPNKLDDVSWIKPGKVAWDWWNDWNIRNVDFEAGCNTKTYEYYIDFAADNNIEYIIIDEGWYHLENIFNIKDEVDVHHLVEYGKSKNVDIILWVTWMKLEDNMDEILKAFHKWGIKGIKVDFMQRDDQWMVEYYERVAETAAKYKLLVDFHGAYKPTGLHRAYPNVISYEGVYGLEQNKFNGPCDATHNLIIPFIRNVAGPMDYTPGAMINVHLKEFKNSNSLPMGVGTRCNEMAKYVVYESALSMLCDNPTHYKEAQECVDFIGQVPTVWDDTKVLEGEIGQYIAVLRRKENTYYLGCMTGDEAKAMNIKLDFLPEGNFECQIWKDGLNAGKNAMDYSQETFDVTSDSILAVKMVKEGGFVCILRMIK